MPTIIVKTGPYQGKYDGLQDLLEVQAERMATCKHQHLKDQSGTCGKGLELHHWSRQRCLDCNEALNSTYVWTPDYEAAKQAEEAFWKTYEPTGEPSLYAVRMKCEYGSFVVWTFSSSPNPSLQFGEWLDGERKHTELGCMSRPSMSDRWQKRYSGCKFELIGIRKKEDR